MEAVHTVCGVVLALSSALAFYAASPHCRWPWLRTKPSVRMVGAVNLVIAMEAMTRAMGAGPGICAALGAWMLGLVLLPYLAARGSPPAGAGDA